MTMDTCFIIYDSLLQQVLSLAVTVQETLSLSINGSVCLSIKCHGNHLQQALW
jgi:hypothetical protein